MTPPDFEEMSQDIPRQNGEELTLSGNENFVRQLLRNFPNGSVNVFDRDLRYVLADGQGLRQEGLSPEMLVGKTLHELFPKESADFVMPYYQRAFAGEDVEFELPTCLTLLRSLVVSRAAKLLGYRFQGS